VVLQKRSKFLNGFGFGRLGGLGDEKMIVEGLVLGHDTVDVEVFGVGEGIGLELQTARRAVAE
jgi:hypothetical protein